MEAKVQLLISNQNLIEFTDMLIVPPTYWPLFFFVFSCLKFFPCTTDNCLLACSPQLPITKNGILYVCVPQYVIVIHPPPPPPPPPVTQHVPLSVTDGKYPEYVS